MKKLAALVLAWWFLFLKSYDNEVTLVYDGYVRDRASLNADNVSEKESTDIQPDLSEDVK